MEQVCTLAQHVEDNIPTLTSFVHTGQGLLVMILLLTPKAMVMHHRTPPPPVATTRPTQNRKELCENHSYRQSSLMLMARIHLAV